MIITRFYLLFCLFYSFNLCAQTTTQTTIQTNLAHTEKGISQLIQNLHQLNTDTLNSKEKIQQLLKKQQQLDLQLQQQQELLAKQIQASYQMHISQPFFLSLYKNNSSTVDRLLMYYHILIQTRKSRIHAIIVHKQQLLQTHQALLQAIAQQQQTKETIQQKKHTLEQFKQTQQTLLQNLINHPVVLKHPAIHVFQPSSYPLIKNTFAKMQHHLPYPLTQRNISNKQISQQGIHFYAAEGTAIYAVYPGRIVFSDWLKGYGLLLIIDHGQGFMTLYAHNQSLFKQKDASIKQGDLIATVGHTGGIFKNELYFEIRKQGKAIQPLA